MLEISCFENDPMINSYLRILLSDIDSDSHIHLCILLSGIDSYSLYSFVELNSACVAVKTQVFKPSILIVNYKEFDMQLLTKA